MEYFLITFDIDDGHGTTNQLIRLVKAETAALAFLRARSWADDNLIGAEPKIVVINTIK